MNKNYYEKPTVDLLVVRFEENIMSGPDGTWNNSIQQGTLWEDNSSDDPYGLE